MRKVGAVLERPPLDWDILHRQFPRLCHVGLVGFPPPNDDVPGHDLMFQTAKGLIDPPHMPRTLVADLGAAWIVNGTTFLCPLCEVDLSLRVAG